MAMVLRNTAGATTSRRAAGGRRAAVAPRAVLEVSENSWGDEVLAASESGPVLVDFWATWCGPCKLVAKVLNDLEPEYGNLKVVKVETDPNPALVEQYGVYGLPTLIVFKDGEMVEGSKKEGAVSKQKLKDYLSEFGVEPAA